MNSFGPATTKTLAQVNAANRAAYGRRGTTNDDAVITTYSILDTKSNRVVESGISSLGTAKAKAENLEYDKGNEGSTRFKVQGVRKSSTGNTSPVFFDV